MRKLILTALLAVSSYIYGSDTTILPAWDALTTDEQHRWKTYVSPLRPNEFDAGDDYRFYRQLLNEKTDAPIELPTTFTQLQRRYLELEISGLIKWHQILASVDKPTTDILQKWVEQNPLAYLTTDTIVLQSIHVRQLAGETTASALNRITKARQLLDAGKPFAEVAMQYSDARSAGVGGTVGTIKRGQLSQRLETLLFDIPGESIVGPVDHENGYHIFRVTNPTVAFNLKNNQDAERAEYDWQRHQAVLMVRDQSEKWVAQNGIEFREFPSDTKNWLLQPWIIHQRGQEPLGLVYMSLANTDLNFDKPGEWNEFWHEEARIHREGFIVKLAAYESVKEDPQLSATLRMALPIYRGIEELRRWYSLQQSSEADLQSLYDEIKDSLTSQTLRSYLMLEVPVNGETDSPQARALKLKKLSATLDSLNRDIGSSTPKTISQAKKLFAELALKYPEARQTSETQIDAVSPLVDPILSRTPVSTLSRPFDNGESAAVLFVTDIQTTTPGYQQVKESLSETWRRRKLDAFTSEIRERAGITHLN